MADIHSAISTSDTEKNGNFMSMVERRHSACEILKYELSKMYNIFMPVLN
jgi:hypothetical protein